MEKNYLEIDIAMNLIKEEIIKDLSDSVSRLRNSGNDKNLTPIESSFFENFED